MEIHIHSLYNTLSRTFLPTGHAQNSPSSLPAVCSLLGMHRTRRVRFLRISTRPLANKQDEACRPHILMIVLA